MERQTRGRGDLWGVGTSEVFFCAHQNFRQKCRSNPLRTQAFPRSGEFLVPPKIPPKEGWHPLAQ